MKLFKLHGSSREEPAEPEKPTAICSILGCEAPSCSEGEWTVYLHLPGKDDAEVAPIMLPLCEAHTAKLQAGLQGVIHWNLWPAFTPLARRERT